MTDAQPVEAPDPNAYWTARKVLEEPRPPLKMGTGGPRTVWAHCDACGVQKVVPLEKLVAAGHGDHLIASLKLRCECGELGHAKMTWVNPGRKRPDRSIPGPARAGFYDFATGESKGSWN